jgi:SpoIID/LytB domain protein
VDITDAVLQAVCDTRGKVLVNGRRQLIDANYSKSCGGIIEAPQTVWSIPKPGQRAAPDCPPGSVAEKFMPVTEDNLDEYLGGDWLRDADVYCSPNVVGSAELARYLGKVDEKGSYFRWRLEYWRPELEQCLQDKLFHRDDMRRLPAMQTLLDLRVLHRGPSGRIARLAIDYLDVMGGKHTVELDSEYAIRDALHAKFLYSSAFKIEIEREQEGIPSRITITGAGWGHGAGLCQIGALGMALKSHDAESIIRHYFEEVSIHRSY